MSAMALLQHPTMPEDVAATILEALTTASPRLRYTVGSEAESLLRNRALLSAEEWIAIPNADSDEGYAERMRPIWGEKLAGSTTVVR